MSIFKIMPHPMIGTLYQGEYTKVVKLRLKEGKRLPKHQQGGYNVFIVPSDGQLNVVVNETDDYRAMPGDVFEMGGEDEFSIWGIAEENPFLYFIVPQTQELTPCITPSKQLGECYVDDLIRFSRHQLIDNVESLQLGSMGDEYLVLCYTGEVSAIRASSEKKTPFRLMQGDLLHFSGDESVQITRKSENALLLVCCLRLA
ncbi:MAG: hypothetical protein ACRCVN_01315 [Spirochaetia bacterium]